jgi:hypothetical protein
MMVSALRTFASTQLALVVAAGNPVQIGAELTVKRLFWNGHDVASKAVALLAMDRNRPTIGRVARLIRQGLRNRGLVNNLVSDQRFSFGQLCRRRRRPVRRFQALASGYQARTNETS